MLFLFTSKNINKTSFEEIKSPPFNCTLNMTVVRTKHNNSDVLSYISKSGGVGFKPLIAVGNPVSLENRIIGKIKGVNWEFHKESLEIEFESKEPIQIGSEICVILNQK